jgi:hypothetical protein
MAGSGKGGDEDGEGEVASRQWAVGSWQYWNTRGDYMLRDGRGKLRRLNRQ